MNTSPYLQKYQQAAVQTSSGPQLLLMLYDGAIKFVRSGIEGIEERKPEKANTNLQKAQRIVNELTASLNFDYEISNNLARLYEYMMHQLIQANSRKAAEPAREVLNYLIDMRETWATAMKKPIMESTQ
ncbi:flagellar export chaperone FliS [Cohnella panacarvi]|uniref:flagellar export chaperone FliS n=1 Tax=Cohnella panacarvi TaxID=400776 RepID=UPI00047E092B|nr:flagellar export chaperone FliS [Cohnella panacarvi]